MAVDVQHAVEDDEAELNVTINTTPLVDVMLVMLIIFLVTIPVILKTEVRKQALTVPLPAPRYWQSLHQHTRVTIGGSALSHWIPPQRHRPVIVIACSRQKRRSP